MGFELSDLNPLKALGPVGDAIFGKDTRREDLQAALDKYDPQSQLAMGQLQQQMLGEKSFAAEQARQTMQQGIAGAQAQAATARPGGQVAGLRQALQTGGRLTSALAGQSAMARLAEQQQAAQSYSSLLLGLRGQDLQAQLGMNANPTNRERIVGAGQALGVAALMSDERVKKDVRRADDKATALLEGLKAYSYKYKDPKHGEGEQLGVMAQDLERAGLSQAVIDTPEGKAVHGAKLAGALAAATSSLHRRVKKLEGNR